MSTLILKNSQHKTCGIRKYNLFVSSKKLLSSGYQKYTENKICCVGVNATVVYCTKEAIPWLARLPLNFNGGLAKLGLTSFMK